jgi:hypothetical protein
MTKQTLMRIQTICSSKPEQYKLYIHHLRKQQQIGHWGYASGSDQTKDQSQLDFTHIQDIKKDKHLKRTRDSKVRTSCIIHACIKISQGTKIEVIVLWRVINDLEYKKNKAISIRNASIHISYWRLSVCMKMVDV